MVAIVGCATSAATSGGSRNSNVVTAEELAAFNWEGKTAYDVVSRLRPSWLRVRGVQGLPRASDVAASDSSEYALVIVDGHPMGRVGLLRDIEAYQLSDLRYSDPSEAGGKFGTRGANGAIEVRLKTRR
jgi:hypothetical protein